jgi:acetyl esterase/lipase
MRTLRYVIAAFALAPGVAPAGAQRSRVAAEEIPFTGDADVAYRGTGDSTQRLLLLHPVVPVDAKPDARFATVVFIHGGGLTSGDRRDPPVEPMCRNFLTAKMACASVNYRLLNTAKWPAQPQDVAAAIAWVLDHVGSLGGDPKRVFIFGHSSGCYLASLVATDTSYLATYQHSPRDLAGVIAMGCLLRQVPPAISDSTELRRFFESGRWIYASLEAFRDADPTRHVGSHVPPFLVLIAEAEQTQPPILENARAFADRMREAGRPVTIDVLPDRRHMTALTMMQDPLDPTFMRVVGFASAKGRGRGTDR